ncbi:MAG: GNAT family N-acetyltransferase [Mycobacteriales bacterium]
MTTPSTWWPLADLRIITPDLTLRPLAEADLAPLAGRLPADVEFDPALPTYGGANPAVARGTGLHQTYWRALGNWRIESWNLLLAVLYDDEVIGVQSLEGSDFAHRRTVETWSFLLSAARGRGFGKSMRRAVLSLAFDHLGALAAETEALAGNGPSLGVSRALGYLPNGETFHPHADALELMVRLRLTRERCRSLRRTADVDVAGLEACRHLFGV